MARSYGPADLLERTNLPPTDPDNATSRVRRGALLHLEGDVEEAARLYRDVLADHPDHGVAHNNLGFLLAQAGQVEEAVAHYEAALEANPRSSMALTNLGNARISQGDPTGIQLLESAIDAAPENPIAWDSLGRARLLFEDLGGAEQAFRNAVELAPDGGSALVTLGAVVAAQGRVTEAIAILEEAVQRDPQAAVAWHQLGMVRFARKDLGAARDALATATRLDPGRIDAHRQLALTMAALGETERAVVQFRQLLATSSRADVAVDLAILELASGSNEQARTRLLEVSQSVDDDRVDFHLALAHLACADVDAASGLFQQIAKTDSQFADQAAEYLTMIQQQER